MSLKSVVVRQKLCVESSLLETIFIQIEKINKVKAKKCCFFCLFLNNALKTQWREEKDGNKHKVAAKHAYSYSIRHPSFAEINIFL